MPAASVPLLRDAKDNHTHSKEVFCRKYEEEMSQVEVKPDPTLCPQFHPSMSQRELPVPIYVTRGEIQRLDNAHDLHGEP